MEGSGWITESVGEYLQSPLGPGTVCVCVCVGWGNQRLEMCVLYIIHFCHFQTPSTDTWLYLNSQ